MRIPPYLPGPSLHFQPSITDSTTSQTPAKEKYIGEIRLPLHHSGATEQSLCCDADLGFMVVFATPHRKIALQLDSIKALSSLRKTWLMTEWQSDGVALTARLFPLEPERGPLEERE